jgi:hypothetical protein
MTETNARMAALERLAERVQIWCAARNNLDGHSATRYDTQALFDALYALPAPAPAPAQAQAQGETVEVVEPKTVQIAAISAGNGVAASIFALRSDGTIWGKRVDRDNAKWWREEAIPTIPTIRATVEGGGE